MAAATHRHFWLTTLSLATCVSAASHGHFIDQDARNVIDPRPPILQSLDGRPPAKASATEELKSFASPRPLPDDAVTSDWPGLLGPSQDGHCVETALRTDFEDDPPTLLWTYETGNGYAAPAIADGRLVFAHRIGGQVRIDCLDAETGKRFWRHSHPCAFRGEYITDNGPRSTPVIADDRVFVHSVEGWLFCLDLATGQEIWKRNPSQEFKIGDQFFGVVSSPVVYGSLLIQNLGAPNKLGGASVAAFDTATGKLVWVTGSKWGPSCASPVIAKLHGRDRLLVVTGGKTRPPTGGLMVLEPETGELILEHPFRSRTYESVNGANPVAVGGESVYLTASYGVGTARIDIAEDGAFEQRWKNRHIGVQFSTPLFVDGWLYLIDGTSDRAGAVVCMDPATGEEKSRTDIVWDEQVFHQGEMKTLPMSIGEGSMLYVQGRALVLGDNGHLIWVDLDPEGPKEVSRATLFRANESWTPPAISRGLLYVCQNRRERYGRDPQPPRLMCFDMRAARED